MRHQKPPKKNIKRNIKASFEKPPPQDESKMGNDPDQSQTAKMIEPDNQMISMAQEPGLEENNPLDKPLENVQPMLPIKKQEERLPRDNYESVQLYSQQDQLALNESFDDGIKRGLQVVIFRLLKHHAESHLRIMCGVWDDSNTLLMDDNGAACSFFTTTHNPFDADNKDQRDKLLPTQVFNLNSATLTEDAHISNKACKDDIVYHEEYKFYKNLPRHYRKYKRNIYIGFQVIEKPKPREILLGNLKDLSYRSNASQEKANFGNMEYELKG